MIGTEQLVEECLGDVLRRHQEEIRDLEAQLAEAQASKASPPDVQQFYIAEVRRLEGQLSSLQQRYSPTYLHGPAASIEHEVLRRRHLSEVQRLESALVAARLRLERLGLSRLVGQQGTPVSEPVHLTTPVAPIAWQAWGPPVDAVPPMRSAHTERAAARSGAGTMPPQGSATGPHAHPSTSASHCCISAGTAAASPQPIAEIVPESVVVERRRCFGNRVFRLWVEDCALRHGVRIHAMDVASLAQTDAEVCDADLQAMYSHFVIRRRELARRRWINMEVYSSSDGDHDHDLQDFLTCLLDSAYFELSEGHDKIELRLPRRVDPPLAESQAHDVIEIEKKSQESELSVSWIRDRILVPRSVLADARQKQRQAKSANTSCSTQRSTDHPRDNSMFSSERDSRSRPRSAQSARPARSAVRPPTQDFSPYAVGPRQPVAGPAIARPRSASSSAKARAASAGRPSSAPQEKRPNSARGPRKPPAPRSRGQVCRRPSSQGRRLEVSEMSCLSCPSPDVSRQSGDGDTVMSSFEECSTLRDLAQSDTQSTMEYARSMELLAQRQSTSCHSTCSGRTRPEHIWDKLSKVGHAGVYDDRAASDAKPSVAMRQRLPRPSSAKALKHKRVVDCNEQPSIYEDTEASVCGDMDVLQVSERDCQSPDMLGALDASLDMSLSLSPTATERAAWDAEATMRSLGSARSENPLSEPRQSTPPRGPWR